MKDAFARWTDPDTSHDAAASVSPTWVENEVYRVIPGNGAIWDELAIMLPTIPKASISPRFKPLRKKGLIEARYDENGDKIKRAGRSGRSQTVWFKK